MILTILGLAIAAAVALFGIATDDRPPKIKYRMGVLTAIGLGVGIWSATVDDSAKSDAITRATKLQADLDEAKALVKRLTVTTALVKTSVDDLSVLKEISGKTTFYVQVSAAEKPENLLKSLNNIYENFPGAKGSGLVCIREPAKGSKEYLLVFGQHIDLAAAEVFHRLATSHRFPPVGDFASVHPENGTKCWVKA